MSPGEKDDCKIFEPRPSPEAVAHDLQAASGVWAIGACAAEIEAALNAGDQEKVRYLLKVMRHLAKGLLEL